MKAWLFSGVIAFVSLLLVATLPAAERTLHLPEQVLVSGSAGAFQNACGRAIR